MHGAHRKAQRRVVAKRVVDPFGDEAAVAHAELWVAAEKELHEDVRGTVQLEDDAERAGEFVDDQVRDANAPGLQGRHALFGRLRARATNEPFAGAFFVATTIGRALAVGAFVFGSGAAGLLHLKRATLRGSVLSHGKKSLFLWEWNQPKSTRLRAVSSSITVRPFSKRTRPSTSARTHFG